MELRERKYIKNSRMLPKFKTPSNTPLTDTDVVGNTNDSGTVKSRWYNNIDAGSAITGTLGTAASIYDAHQFNTTSNDYINKYGTTNQHIGDIGYTKFNDINRRIEMDIVKQQNTANTFNTTLTGAGTGAGIGAGVGTMIGGPVGTLIGGGIGALGGALVGLIGGLFGGGHRKRKAERALREALLKVDNYNEMNRSDALTSSLQQNQAEKYGDTRSQTLFSYDGGKDAVDPVTRSTVKDHVVETAEGTKIDKQNSWVSKGEGVWNPSTGYANYITHGPNDTARANLKSGDVVFGSEYNPVTGNRFKDDAAPYIVAKQQLNKTKPNSKGWMANQTQLLYEKITKTAQNQIDAELGNLASIQKQVHEDMQTGQLMRAKCGKNAGSLPGYKDGLSWASNFIPSAFGMIGSLKLYFDAKGDEPYAPNTYEANPYQRKALNTLAELRVSPYPITQQLRDAEARTNYAVNASGGLSSAQKHLSRLASLDSTQLNIAKMLASVQAQNNAYRSNYASAALQSGEQEAVRNQSARQFDLDYYTKAHAARQQGMQMGMYNFLNNINQYGANEFKRIQGKNMLDLYRLKLNQNQRRLVNEIGNKTGSDKLFSSFYYIPLSIGGYLYQNPNDFFGTKKEYN